MAERELQNWELRQREKRDQALRTITSAFGDRLMAWWRRRAPSLVDGLTEEEFMTMLNYTPTTAEPAIVGTSWPPYTGEHAKCSKCATPGPSTRYQARIAAGGFIWEECLQRTCHTCGYTWTEACATPA